MGVAYATSPSSEYLPPVSGAPSNEYLPPSKEYLAPVQPAHSLESDGYHYKTVRRYRHKRDAPINEYLPPQATEQHKSSVDSPSKQPQLVIAPAGVSAKATLEDRDFTSKIDSYAPPASGSSQDAVAAASSPAHSLEDDGYHYRTVKRYRLRH